MITKDEYYGWINHPVTQIYFDELRQIELALTDAMYSGMVLESPQKMGYQLGLIEAYRSAISYEPSFNDDGFMLDEAGEEIE